jgi:hypothetical protein
MAPVDPPSDDDLNEQLTKLALPKAVRKAHTIRGKVILLLTVLVLGFMALVLREFEARVIEAGFAAAGNALSGKSKPHGAIVELTPKCGANNYVDLQWRADNEGQDGVFWAFVQPDGSSNWYPSAKPLPDATDGSRARIFLGPAVGYMAFVLFIPRDSVRDIEDYLEDRKKDGSWALGMPTWPKESIEIAHEPFVEVCPSLQ